MTASELHEKEGYHFVETQPVLDRIATFAKQHDVSEPRFGYYPILQQMNLLNIETRLVKLWAKYKATELGADDLTDLQTTFKEYCQAIRDFDFILRHREPNEAIQTEEKQDRVAKFRNHLREQGFPNTYRAFVKPVSLNSDLLLAFISNRLPKKLAWSRSERRRRSEEYNHDGKPLEYSTETRFLASVIILDHRTYRPHDNSKDYKQSVGSFDHVNCYCFLWGIRGGGCGTTVKH
ncbi:uncharacterized protein LY89DRAFT_735098 [Mollisia scopiformis]|uniref:Uncharacterized protein n=1 Tax=Mollisia scopiformis TaxID=149040 RepID=A0A194X708_MOLSC|nr:uncharacterized protein LY89DRAFT_735098 [Mollisia scopiformis]KUJ15956.1 hypothetical protein LY89DRAFT_735098 [Mollisia scopiformis]